MSVKLGFIGCGGITHSHLHALASIPEAEPVAFSDADGTRAEALAQRYTGGRAYPDYRSLLDDAEIDALFVCVPPHGHVGAEEAACARGVHLFVEKPVALQLEQARTIKAAIAESGVINAVGYHWRNMPTVERARQELNGELIGSVIGYYMHGMPPVPWWRRMQQSGGQFVEQTTHIVDLARYLIGEITEVLAVYDNRCLDRTVEGFSVHDTGTVLVRFVDGTLGTFHSTCLAEMGWRIGLDVVTPNVVTEIGPESLKVTRAGEVSRISNAVNPRYSVDRAFITAVATGDRTGILSNYSDAVRTLAVTLAANESARTGRWVKVGNDAALS